VSTNNRWRKLKKTSDPLGDRQKSRGNHLADVGIAQTELEVERGPRPDRPRTASAGQVVSCRLPAEELQAFDARLEDIRYELVKIGTNVNQIALAANRGRAPMVRAQWASVEELRRSMPMVAKALTQIIAEQRRQGVALFRRFAEAHEGANRG
jgi:hypothetical protein